MSTDEKTAPAPFSVDHMPKENWGQKPFVPTQVQRDQVLALAQAGMKQERMCLLIINPGTGYPIDEKTLRAHFREELDRGYASGDALVLQKSLQVGVGSPAEFDDKGNCVREEIKPDKGMLIWQTKARPGIKWTERVEHTGKDGGPMEHQHHGLDLSKYTEQELDQLESLLAKGGAAAAPVAGGDQARAPKTQH